MGVLQFREPDALAKVRTLQSTITRPQYSFSIALFRAVDGLCIFFCLLGVLTLFGRAWNLAYSVLSILLVVTFGFWAEAKQVYNLMHEPETWVLAWLILRSWLFALILTSPCVLLWLLPNLDLAVLTAWAILTPLLLVSAHLLQRVVPFRLRRHRLHAHFEQVGIVGSTALGLRFYDTLNNMPWLGYEIAGIYDDRSNISLRNRGVTRADLTPCGGLERLYSDVREGKIDTIYITLPMCAENRIKVIMDDLADTTVTAYLVPDFSNFDLLYSRMKTIRGIPAISIYDSPLVDHGFAKRCSDIVLSILFILLSAVPMLLIAAAIKATSPGPILFKQTRYGIGGGPIKVWKFRTMTVCQDGANVRQATQHDSRLTPIGGFLRHTSLDELPQFFNVLGGSMSIVGPRPHAVAHNEYYRQHIKGYMLRHKVKPGITGLAQINGCRGETAEMKDMSSRIDYDLEYIRRWSLGMDLRIILQSFYKGFIHKKAY